MLLTPRSIETAKQYLAEKHVPQLMEGLTSDLIEHKPEDPLDYIVRWSQSHLATRSAPANAGKPKLYLFAVSVNCLSSAVLLNEAGVDFERIDLEPGKHRTPELLAVNPAGAVPAFKDGDVNLAESQSILRYISNRFPTANKFYPAAPAPRAKVELAMDWRQTQLYPAISMACYPLLGFNTEHENLEPGRRKLAQALDFFVKHLVHPNGFVAGSDVTIADLSIGVSLEYLDVLAGFAVPSEVQAYRERLGQRCPSIATNLAAVRGYVGSLKPKLEAAHAKPMKFFQFGMSINCLQAHLMIKDAGIPIEVVNLDFMGGEHKKPEYLEVNPLGLVPALEDGELRLNESQSIMRYVANKHALGAPWYPTRPDLRAAVDSAMDWRQTSFYPHVSKLCYPILFGFPAEAPEAREKTLEALHKDCEYLEKHLLKGSFIGGDKPCLADYSIAPNFEFCDVLPDFHPSDAVKEYRKRFVAASPNYAAVCTVLHGFLSSVKKP